MKRKSTIRQIGQIVVGYFTVGIFILSFLMLSRHAKDWLGLSAPLSEATVLTIAAVMAGPLVLPFVLERISKLKLGELEIDLVQVSARVEENLAYELISVEVKSRPSGLEKVPDLATPISDWRPADQLVTAFKEAETTHVIEVNLGTGTSWLASRLFLLASLAEDYTDIHQMLFLEDHQTLDRVFVGSATPVSVRQGLAWDNPRLREAYEVAKREPPPALDNDAPERRVTWIAWSFLSKLSEQNEKEAHEWVTTQSLELSVPINKYCIEWNNVPFTALLLHQILDRIEPYVCLVKSSGQLNLVIDRLKLAEQIAKHSLRQRLE